MVSVECDISCISCKGPTNADCWSCDPLYYFVPLLGICESNCPDAYYPLFTPTKQCFSNLYIYIYKYIYIYIFIYIYIYTYIECSEHCLDCSSSTLCSNCEEDFYLIDMGGEKSCVDECIDGYYMDPGSQFGGSASCERTYIYIYI